MVDEVLKQFANNLKKHIPNLGERIYAFSHLKETDIDDIPWKAAPPAPPPGPPPPLENVQGVFSFREETIIIQKVEKLMDNMKESIEERKKCEEFDKMVNKTVPEMLMEAAKTYEKRQAVYGDNYKNFGTVMMGLFPNGIMIDNADTWNKIGIFIQMCSKMTRIASQFPEVHDDSALDLSVYSNMLRELGGDK